MKLKDAPIEVQELVAYALSKGGATNEKELTKYYDIYYNTPAASGPPYHDNSNLWDAETARKIIKARKAINLVKPSVKYYISQIYSGSTQRRIENAGYQFLIQPMLDSVDYHNRIVTAIEMGYVFGQSYIVPVVNESEDGTKRLKFWMPNPVVTDLGVDPDDISNKLFLIEYTKGNDGKISKLRFIMKGFMGVYDHKSQTVELQSAPTNILPVATALGESLYPIGIPNGKSLVEPAVNASIAVTHHNLMLEIIKSMIAHNIICVYGNPIESGDDQQGKSLQPIYSFDMTDGKRDGDIEIKSFPSKLQDIINLKRSTLETLSVEMGIPLDIFLPSETASLGDASATAARTKALPSTASAKMRLDQAHQFEREVIKMMLAVLAFDDILDDIPYETIFSNAKIDIQILPSEAISYAESVASTIQLLDKGLIRKQDAIKKFNPQLTDEEIAKLLGDSENPQML